MLPGFVVASGIPKAMCDSDDSSPGVNFCIADVSSTGDHTCVVPIGRVDPIGSLSSPSKVLVPCAGWFPKSGLGCDLPHSVLHVPWLESWEIKNRDYICCFRAPSDASLLTNSTLLVENFDHSG
ncbi:hypothetical protein Salat_1894300 [Sesamum alatum]|uniref:Uncharacterized protein n=1 Tax=Sesamum alatum TaxID=300844 RepID=A0AAE1Y4F2_9LAMI|nr:hypothetical protein Salat_1894300 [Sesamum alatum]